MRLFSLSCLCLLSITVYSNALSNQTRSAEVPSTSSRVVDDDVVREAKRVLRTAGTTSEERDAARFQMLEAGLVGAKDLLASEVARSASLHKQRRSQESKFAKQFEKAAQRVARKRRSKKSKVKRDELRDVIAKHARDESLTKDTIKRECDPARDTLLELTFVPVSEVLAGGKGLVEASAAIADLRGEVSNAHEWIDRILAEFGDELARPKKLGAVPLHSWDEELEFLVLLSATESKGDRSALLANRELESKVRPEEAAGTLILNRWRVAFGQGVYKIDVLLCDAGRDHSKDMHELEFFSHTSPVEGKETFGQRASNFKTSASSENIAMGADTGEGSIIQWWYSPGHHRNMLGGSARTGLGQFEQHWTQLFGN